MKKFLVVATTLALAFTLCAMGVNQNSKKGLSLSWTSADKKYTHFTDAGNYFIIMNDANYADFDKASAYIEKTHDVFKQACTATVKKNKKGEVIVGRNMDVEIAQTPAYVTKIKGGKYETISFYYGGNNTKYRYDELDKLDKDEDFLNMIPYAGTDAFNEKGLYVEVNMREMDDKYDFYCSGTNPKAKVRAATLEAPALIALNAATVDEALEYLKTVDWYTLGFHDKATNTTLLWNMGLIIGDAEGNYGLIEFGKNGVYYTPYANGQGNYYINPELAEYAIQGTGYGRFAKALEGLSKCETAEDMMNNMEKAMWKHEVLKPGSFGYSDFETDVNKRRETSQADLQKGFEKQLLPKQEMIKKYYAGDEKALRDDGTVWTTSFNFGVNCAQKHLILRLFEKDNIRIEYQW